MALGVQEQAVSIVVAFEEQVEPAEQEEEAPVLYVHVHGSAYIAPSAPTAFDQGPTLSTSHAAYDGLSPPPAVYFVKESEHINHQNGNGKGKEHR